MSSSNPTTINLPAKKNGTKIQIGLPSAKPKAKPALASLCDYGDSDESNQSSDEEIEPIPKAKIEEKKPLTGLLSFLPPPKSKNNPFIKKTTSQASSSNENYFTTTSTKNHSAVFKDAKSLVPHSLKAKTSAESSEPSFKKAKPSYQTYINKPDPHVPTFFEADEDPEPEYEEEEPEDKQQQFNPEEFGQPSLNQEALRQLGGKRKNQFDNIEITDVKMNDIIGDNKSELMKNITSNYKPPSNRDFFGGSSKKKHQITYLAYVAKERDEELKNSWAQAAFNKKQSRERYGF